MTMAQWKLVHEETGKPIQIGDELVTFRGEKVKVVGRQPPHKPEATAFGTPLWWVPGSCETKTTIDFQNSKALGLHRQGFFSLRDLIRRPSTTRFFYSHLAGKPNSFYFQSKAK